MKILLVSLSPAIEVEVKNYKGLESDSISSFADFETLVSSDSKNQYQLIFAGNNISEVRPLELAQTLKSLFPNSKIIYLSDNRKDFERIKFLKNGFDDTYILPIDYKYFKNELKEYERFNKGQEKLKPIRLVDLAPNTVLDFHIYIYLEKNEKFIKYVAAGTQIGADKLEKLKSSEYDVVFVPENQMDLFYKYSSEKVAKIGEKISTLSKTQQIEQLQKEIRKLFSLLLDDLTASDFDFGKNIMDSAKDIVSRFIQPHSSNNWFDTLKQNLAIGDSDAYFHNLNTSVYASLIAIGLGYKNPEDFAMAGLFHDLGLQNLSAEFIYKPYIQMTPQEKELYEKHPVETLNILKAKRVIVSQNVQKMIMQHHEKANQTGFPEKVDPTKLMREAQILAISDEIEKATHFKNKEKKSAALEILAEMTNKRDYELDLLNSIKLLFEGS